MYGSDENGKVFEEEGSQETQPHEETEEYLTDAKDAHIQPELICPNDFILADISIASPHSSNDDAQGPFIEEEIPSGDPHMAEMIVPHPAINELLPVHEPGDEVIVQHPADNDIRHSHLKRFHSHKRKKHNGRNTHIYNQQCKWHHIIYDFLLFLVL